MIEQLSDERTTRRFSRPGWRLLAPSLGLTVLAVVGCSSGAAATDGGSGAGSTGGSGDAAMQAFAQCMSQNGVTLPAPPSGSIGAPGEAQTPPSGAPPAGGAGTGGTGGQAPAGVDPVTWQAAQQACASLVPTPPGGQGAEPAG